MKNTTKRVRLSFGSGSGTASFDFADAVTELVVDLPAFVPVVRSVFLAKESTAAVVVVGEEVDTGGSPVNGGIRSRTILAPDPSAPVDPALEEHDVSLDLLLNPGGSETNSLTYENPLSGLTSADLSLISNLLNPGVISPGVISPGVISPGVISPGVISPGVISPGVISPGVISPGVISPGVISPGVISQPLVTDT